MQAFLFTDIEASTRLWEERPEDMARSLERHDEIIGEAIAAAGGQILKTTGDGVIAVFDSPADSLTATVKAQRELIAESWVGSGPIRVRMGIHTGETETREGDHFGPVMNRAARIMAAAHGGQVLVSAGVAAEPLPDGVSLIDLGTHRLKDLTEPERIYQVSHHGLPAEFPPPLTLDTHPHNLPYQTTEFLGRASELGAIQLMLGNPTTRLLTIAGPGGAGKTRLGLQVAAEQLHKFEDGVFFVDLARERDPDAAYEAILRSLDLPVSGTGDALDTLKSQLRDKSMMLVLDNFEQVTPAAAGIAELILHSPGLKVIVTSRETLKVRAEQVFPVPPLELPHPDDDPRAIAEVESVQLFVDRARAVQPGFRLDEGNARTIAEICLRLEGLPLAIELAAARLNVFSPADLLTRLRDRLDVLGAGGRDLPDRQRTLWGAIGWSYELLDEPERDLFAVLSVFSSAWLESIEMVARDSLPGADVLEALASLVDKSLMRSEQSDGSRRFSMLLMIREYADTRLAERPDLQSRARLAHAEHYSAYALRLHDDLRGENREEALEDLAREIGNLRTAWRYWVEHAELKQLFELIEALWALHEAKGWYHAAIELAGDALDVMATKGDAEASLEELTIRTSLARALMAVRGYTPEVEQAFKRVLELSERAGEDAGHYPIMRALATYYMNIAEFETAASYGRRLLDLAESEDDDAMRAEGHYVTGAGIAFVAGHVEEGIAHLEKAIELFDRTKHRVTRFRLGPSTAVIARVASGLIQWQQGRLGIAMRRLSEALELARTVDHPYSLAYALYHNGFFSLIRNRFEDARGYADELAQVAGENDYLLWSTLAQVLEGVSLTALGEAEKGLSKTEVAIDIYQGLTAPPVFWPLMLSLRARVHAFAGRPEQALELVDAAIGFAGENEGMTPDLEMLRADILLMLPDHTPEESIGIYELAADGAASQGMKMIELGILNRLVSLQRQLGISPDGRDRLAEVYATFTDGFEEDDVATARELIS